MGVGVASTFYTSFSPWNSKKVDETQVQGDENVRNDVQDVQAKDDFVTLTLKSDVKVDSSRAIFTDIIECEGSHLRCSEVYSIDLGLVFKNLVTRTISRMYIKSVLDKENLTFSYRLSGADFVKIARKGVVVRGEEVAAQLVSILASNLVCNPSCRYQIEKPKVFRKFRLASDEREIAITNLDSLRLSPGKKEKFNTLKVNYLFTSDRSKEYASFVKVHYLEKVAIARTSLVKGQRVVEEDFIYDWKRKSDVPYGYKPPTFSSSEIVVKSPFEVGEIFDYKKVYVPYVVMQGQKVRVYSKEKSLEVSLDGTALNNGRVGDVIAVRVKSKVKNRLMGKVQKDGTVAL